MSAPLSGLAHPPWPCVAQAMARAAPTGATLRAPGWCQRPCEPQGSSPRCPVRLPTEQLSVPSSAAWGQSRGVRDPVCLSVCPAGQMSVWQRTLELQVPVLTPELPQRQWQPLPSRPPDERCPEERREYATCLCWPGKGPDITHYHGYSALHIHPLSISSNAAGIGLRLMKRGPARPVHKVQCNLLMAERELFLGNDNILS